MINIEYYVGAPADHAMAMQVQPEVLEADVTEEDGVFFQAHGAVCFTPESELSPDAYKGAGQVLAVSRRHGIIIVSDPRGEHKPRSNVAYDMLCTLRRPVLIGQTRLDCRGMCSSHECAASRCAP